MSNAIKKEKSEGGYACAGVLALSLAVMMHFAFAGMEPEQVDALPRPLAAVYRSVGIAAFSFPLGAFGLGLILREVFGPRRARPERPRVVIKVRRPEPAAPPEEVEQPQAALLAEPAALSEAAVEPAAGELPEAEEVVDGDPTEPTQPGEPGRPKIPGRWAVVRLNARRGTTADVNDPEGTAVVESGGGRLQLSSEKYMGPQTD